MLELTGVGSVLRGISILYWLLAAGALALVLWKVRRWWGKSLGALIVVCVFGYFPVQEMIEANKRAAYAREAWAYFKKKCDEESGEKIYKTFTGVKSVLVVKPLPPATEKDLYDQFWYGDPYSSATAHERRSESASSSLIGSVVTRGLKPKTPAESSGFDFVEMVEGTKTEQRYIKFSLPDPRGKVIKTVIVTPISRFGISWEDISTSEDRKYWVAGSRLRAIDLTDNSIVAERIGFFIEAGFGSTAGQRRPWLTSRGPNTTCPKIEHSFDEDRFFIQKALNPTGEN